MWGSEKLSSVVIWSCKRHEAKPLSELKFMSMAADRLWAVRFGTPYAKPARLQTAPGATFC